MPLIVDEFKSALRARSSDAIVNLLVEIFSSETNEAETLLGEYMETLSKKDALLLWELVLADLNGICSGVEASCKEAGFDSAKDSSFQKVKSVVQGINLYQQKSTGKQENAELNEHVFRCLLILCKLLDSIDCEDVMVNHFKNTLSTLCEKLYLQQEKNTNKVALYFNCEEFLPNVFTYLFLESLKFNAKETFVKRIYALRNGLNIIELNNADNRQFAAVLTKCFVHPTYLKSSDGIKLLSVLLQISEGYLLEPSIEVIKFQMTQRMVLSEVYGEILYSAWKANVDRAKVQQPVVEPVKTIKTSKKTKETAITKPVIVSKEASLIEDCFQQFVQCAIHCGDKKAFQHHRTLIKAFHDVKRCDELEEMLSRVYEPIIWRSLRCANATVRAQAAAVFFDVFPLQKAAVNPEESDQLLQKQFDQLIMLLKDGDQRVREIAAQGVCYILKEYWDCLPLAATQNILKFLFDTLAVDSASNNVRKSVFDGVTLLLDQPQAHGILKSLLPCLGKSIHDKSDKVRLAFIHLLQKVKNIRDMHFYDIVSLEALHQCLIFDAQAQCTDNTYAIADLLFHSYFPLQDNTSSVTNIQIERMLAFIDDNAVAAKVFYSYLHRFISVGSLAKFCAMTFTVLISTMKELEIRNNSEDKKATKRRRNVKDDMTADEPKTLTAAEVNKLHHRFTGLLSILLAIFEGNAETNEVQFAGQLPSLQFLFKYLTPAHLQHIVDFLSREAFNTTALLTNWLSIVQIVTCVMEMIVGSDEDGELEGTKQAIKDMFHTDFVTNQVFAVLATTAESNATYNKQLAMKMVTLMNSCGSLVDLIRTMQTIPTTTTKKGAKAPKAILTVDDHTIILVEAIQAFACNPLIASTLDNTVSEEISSLFASVNTWVSTNTDNALAMRLLHTTAQYHLYQDCSSLLLIEEDLESIETRPLNVLVASFANCASLAMQTILLHTLLDGLHLVIHPSAVSYLLTLVDSVLQHMLGLRGSSNEDGMVYSVAAKLQETLTALNKPNDNTVANITQHTMQLTQAFSTKSKTKRNVEDSENVNPGNVMQSEDKASKWTTMRERLETLHSIPTAI